MALPRVVVRTPFFDDAEALLVDSGEEILAGHPRARSH